MRALSNQMIVRGVVARSAVMWVAARGLLMFAGGSPALSGQAALMMVGIIVALTYVDIGRRRERVLLANLGVSMSVVLWLAALPPIVGEVIARAALRMTA